MNSHTDRNGNPINLVDVLTAHLQWCADPARGARANLVRANLAGAHLSGANLAGAYLSSANLGIADLSSAHLSGTYLSSAHLAHANLAGADLAGADLSSADLFGANLAHADLAYADLSSAHLSGANLACANLAHADLSGAHGVLSVSPCSGYLMCAVRYPAGPAIYAGCRSFANIALARKHWIDTATEGRKRHCEQMLAGVDALLALARAHAWELPS